MKLKPNDWLIIAGETGLFLVVLVVLWLDEFVDLPHHLLGAAPTPYRMQEYLLETVLILVVALVVIVVTLAILARMRRNEQFLRVCAWCRKVWVDGKWVSFEEYALKRHSMRSSHGICDECVEKLERKSRDRGAGQ